MEGGLMAVPGDRLDSGAYIEAIVRDFDSRIEEVQTLLERLRGARAYLTGETDIPPALQEVTAPPAPREPVVPPPQPVQPAPATEPEREPEEPEAPAVPPTPITRAPSRRPLPEGATKQARDKQRAEELAAEAWKLVSQWRTGITVSRLLEAGFKNFEAGKALTELYRQGKISVEKLLSQEEKDVTYTTGESVFASWPEASVPVEEMPSWSDNQVTGQMAAHCQNLILHYVEKFGDVVPREVFREVEPYGISWSRNGDVFRDLKKAGLIVETGKLRWDSEQIKNIPAGRKVPWGRPAKQYLSKEAASSPKEPEGGTEAVPPKPAPKRHVTREEVEAWCKEQGRFTPVSLAHHFRISVGTAGVFIQDMDREEKVMRDASRGNWLWIQYDEQDTAEKEEPTVEVPVPPKPARKTAPSAPADASLLAKVRDWVCAQPEGDAFTEYRVAQNAKVSPSEALESLEALAERGVVTDISPSPDMRLFAYEPPKDPGAAFRMQQQQRRGESPERKAAREVAGTGKKMKVTNKDVEKLVSDAKRAGAKIAHAASGHFEVSIPGSKKKVSISATPSNPRSVMNDRVRLRRAGLAV
jgi:ribosomal protein S25